MSNLLPEPAQKKIWAAYRARFFIAGSLLVIAAAFIATLVLVPTYIILLATRPVPFTAFPADTGDAYSTDIAKAKALVAQIGPLATTTALTEVIGDILAKRPRGVHVDSVTYAARNPATCTIVGIAENREKINLYREALMADGRFISVSLPVGDLIGAQGGRFTFTLGIHK